MDNKRELQFKAPIITLAVMALVYHVLSCVTYFVYYTWRYSYSLGGRFELTASFPNIERLIEFFINVAPFILFVIYLLKFYKEFKATILIPIIFGLKAFSSLYNNILGAVDGFFTVENLIFEIPLIIAFTLTAINALKGLSKKAFLIIAVVIGLLLQVRSAINLIQNLDFYLEYELYLYLFTSPFAIFGTTAFYVSLLLFGLKNRIPAICSVSSKKENMSPEQTLKLLKDKLDLGIITEEEYAEQRAEVIKNL